MSNRAAPGVLHLDGGRYWGGGQNQLRLLMRGLAAEGVRQLCLCPAGSPLAERLRAESLPVETVAWRGGSDPRALLAVLRRAGGYDVLHAHDAHALQIALLPAALRRVRVVATRRVHFRTTPLKWNRAARVVAISESVRSALLESGVRPDRLVKVPSGVDADEVRSLPRPSPGLRERLGIAPDAFLVGNIGHLTAPKGQGAIPAAASRLPGVQWAIVGEGPERAALERAVARNQVADRVRLAGLLPDARRVLGELDLFAFPSTDDALGTSVLDAMAAGVPVVAAAAAGPAEILGPVHERTGASLFPPGDAAALAACVRRLRSDPALREEARAAQRERLEDFAIGRTVGAMLALYRDVVEGR